MADRTKSSFSNVNYPGNPNIDASWGTDLLNCGAIQSTENQYAGPGATFRQQPQAGTKAKPPALPRSPKYQ